MKLAQLRDLNRNIRKLIHPEIPAQQQEIFYLVCEKEGITHSEIARELNMPQGTVSRNVLKLGSKLVQNPNGTVKETGYGLLVNREDHKEVRRYAVYLTDKGRKVIRKILDTF